MFIWENSYLNIENKGGIIKMKKLVAILGICILLIGMPAAMSVSISIPQKKLISRENPELAPTTSPTEDPPNWANGNFSGVWGIDIWGEARIPLGWIYGYYRRTVRFGYFYAAFANFGDENDTNFIKGLIVGPFMFGSLGSETSANETIFVGLGGYNETHFYWRIMGRTGPTFFMYGEYSKFEN